MIQQGFDARACEISVPHESSFKNQHLVVRLYLIQVVAYIVDVCDIYLCFYDIISSFYKI